MGKKKNKEMIKVESVGSSHVGVVGSSWMVTYPKKDNKKGKFLIELGCLQLNGRLVDEYNANKNIIDDIPHEEIEFVLVGHANIDHHMSICGLFNKGYRGRVIMTEPNKELCGKLMMDGSYIHNRNIQHLANKGYKLKPLYTEQDVYFTMNNTDTYCMNEIHEINEYISVRFRKNSHIKFATQIEIFIKLPSSKVKKILYTSDIGSNKNFGSRYFLDKTEIIPNSNLAIFEATYSDEKKCFTKQKVKDDRIDMIRVIKRKMKKKCKIIIPTFSMDRTQDLLCFLYDNLKDNKAMDDVRVVLDGRLVHEVNNTYVRFLNKEDSEYFQDVLNWDKLHIVKDFEESLCVAHRRDEKLIVISSAGMANVGRVLNHIKTSIDQKDDTIMLIGFTAKGTIGDNIKNNAMKTINIENKTYEKRCDVKVYNTWSSHIQSDELISYFSQHNTETILLHHSDDNKYEFAKHAKDELYKKGKTTRIIATDEKNSIFYI